MNVTLPLSERDKRRSKDSDGLEFLPAALEIMETPPRPLGRLLAVVIAAFFMIAIVWAALSPIDIVAVAEGRVVPDGQIKIVQPFQAGVVTAIYASEGDHVAAGGILVRLDATEAETNRLRLELELARAELDRAVAEALLSADPIKTFFPPANVDAQLIELSRSVIAERWRNQQSALAENTAEHDRVAAEITALEAEHDANAATVAEFEELNATALKLDEAGLTTRSELANMRLQLISARNDLQGVTQRIAQSKLDLTRNEAQRRQITASYTSEVTGQLSEARQTILLATQELQRLREREDLHLLRAPVSGRINEVAIHTVGAVVSPSEILMTIVPDDVSLEIEATLENRDIGFVEVGQAAEIKLEAFPFTRFGIIDGVVSHISPDAVVDEARGPVYTIRVTPDAQSLNAGDREIRLNPGMRATAEIKTGSRTVLEFFLTPLLRYKDEAIRER